MTTSSTTDIALPFFCVEQKLPIKLESESNVGTTKHWKWRHSRTKAQHAAVALGLRSLLAPLLTAKILKQVDGHQMWMPTISRDMRLEVLIVRIAPCRLDSDNAVGAGKHVRDAIAILLGINDRDRRVDWIVTQEKGKPREYATRFKVSAWKEEQT